jgi:hypothetical protein
MAEPTSQSGQTEQKDAPKSSQPTAAPTVSATGRRPAFQDLKLQLTDEDLANPGTQKCILDMLIRAEEECNDLKEFRSKYHATDKQAGILGEKLKTNKINETLFGVGITMGGTIMGLSPFFYEKGPAYCYITLGVGVVTTLGAAFGRIIFK